jgi:hypothetical protein
MVEVESEGQAPRPLNNSLQSFNDFAQRSPSPHHVERQEESEQLMMHSSAEHVSSNNGQAFAAAHPSEYLALRDAWAGFLKTHGLTKE